MNRIKEFLQAIFRSSWFPAAFSVICTVAVAGAIVYYYFFFPSLGVGPEQPIPFSHRLHAGVKQIDCRFCHNTVERSANAGIPAVEKCLYCHNYIIPEHPQISKLHRAWRTGQPIRWRKVTELPEHVYFSHQRHIRRGEQCASCHGPVETLDRVRQVNEMTMGFCLTCHQNREAPTDCWVCHK
jgi:predicted CXXCH cytochrome family protein